MAISNVPLPEEGGSAVGEEVESGGAGGYRRGFGWRLGLR